MADKKKVTRKLAFGGGTQEIFRAEKDSDNHLSRQEKDPFAGSYGSGGDLTIIEPAYNPTNLKQLPTHSNILSQCIEAMVTNVEGFGYQLAFIGEGGTEDSSEALADKERIESVLHELNPDEDITSLRVKMRTDYETFGYAYVEVIRDVMGEIVAIYHVPAQTVRKTVRDSEATEYTAVMRRGGKPTHVTSKKHFRRYVQIINGQKVFFAEVGDPRSIDPSSGKQDDALAFSERASEMYCLEGYSAGEPYSLPRWVNQLPAILGSRESEEVNLSFFKENAIPSMVVTIGGGSLSQESVDALEEQFSKDRGRDSMHKVLVLEAIVDEEMFDMEGKPMSPRIDVKPLAGQRTSDALFQEYDQKNMDKVRSSFRLPPIFLGNATDYTRATAESSIEIAESQIFSPERRKVDRFINTVILQTGRAPSRFWNFRSNPVKMTGSETTMATLERLNRIGAMTPNIAIKVANEMLDMNMPDVTDAWGDLPFQKTTLTADPAKEVDSIELETHANTDQD